MYRIIKTFLTGLLSFLSCLIQSQNETTKWYFGENAGLDFITNPPTILTNGNVYGQEGSSSISDNSGNLLFYTDGDTIWNKLHVPMSNGTGLYGSVDATQSSIILKQPGNSNIYFVFTLPYNATGGLSYSTIDMNLSAGMGSVTIKNSIAFSGICTEKLAATKHCNGIDSWVVSHDLNNNNFRAFLVSATGVNTMAVVSSVGTTLNYFAGQLKISPQGKKIGLAALFDVPFEIFDFDNSTGIVSNPLVLTNTQQSTYGCEFSPDGTKFYGTAMEGELYQWDLCLNSNSAIQSSLYVLDTVPFLGLQLAKNGKIYAASELNSTIGVINNPNYSGINCNFIRNGQSIFPRLCRFTLPSFNSSFFKKPKDFDFSVDSLICNKLNFHNLCVYSENSITNHLWSFGDIASGVLNSSTLANPTHVFSAAGTYTVQLIRYYTCASDTINKVITVPLCTNLFDLSSNKKSILIYPSPAVNQLIIVFEAHSDNPYNISIFNYRGQIVKNEKIIFNDKKVIINIGDLPNGVYLIKLLDSILSDDSANIIKRFVISR